MCVFAFEYLLNYTDRLLAAERARMAWLNGLVRLDRRAFGCHRPSTIKYLVRTGVSLGATSLGALPMLS